MQYARYPASAVSITGTVTVTSAQLPPALGPQTPGQSLSVVPAQDASVILFRNDYGGTPITVGNYLQVVAATTANVRKIYSFDSSGSLMVIAVGAMGSEVPQAYIPPGGSAAGVDLFIPAGSRVSVTAVDVDATVGQLALTGVS